MAKGLILAAGRSSRFGDLNKLTYPLEGQPLVLYALRNLRGAGVESVAAVVGHDRRAVMACLGQDVDFVIQEHQGGTGHAVLEALPRLQDTDEVVVLFGDCPFIDSDAIGSAISRHRDSQASVTIATAELSDPRAMGRLLRDGDGRAVRIEEGRLGNR